MNKKTDWTSENKSDSTISAKLSRLRLTFSRGLQQISEAAREEIDIPEYQLAAYKNGVLDYELLEADLKHIHNVLTTRGQRVLGTDIVLDEKKRIVVFKTFSKRDDGKIFASKIELNVDKLRNCPKDVEEELREHGLATLRVRDESE